MWKPTTAPLSPSGSEQKTPVSPPGRSARRPGPPLSPGCRIKNTPQKALSAKTERAFAAQRERGRPPLSEIKEAGAARSTFRLFRGSALFSFQAAAAKAFFVKGKQKIRRLPRLDQNSPARRATNFFRAGPQLKSKGPCPELFSDKPAFRCFPVPALRRAIPPAAGSGCPQFFSSPGRAAGIFSSPQRKYLSATG